MVVDLSTITSRRNQIVAEFERRIGLVYDESKFSRGFPYQNVDTFDHFFLFDLPDASSLEGRRRGMYECAFPLSISYWFQSSPDHMFEAGNKHLEAIRLAIEIDENLGDENGNPLVVRYYLDEGALIWYDEGVMDVELMYIVEYVKDAGWVHNPFAKTTR